MEAESSGSCRTIQAVSGYGPSQPGRMGAVKPELVRPACQGTEAELEGTVGEAFRKFISRQGRSPADKVNLAARAVFIVL